MLLSGKTYQDNEVLPFGKIVVVNSLGILKKPTNGVVADIDGNYSINVNPDDYIRVTGGGNVEQRIKVSEVCKQNSCNFNVRLTARTQDVQEVFAVGYRPKVERAEYKKPSWTKFLLIAGISLVAISAIVYGIKKMRK